VIASGEGLPAVPSTNVVSATTDGRFRRYVVSRRRSDLQRNCAGRARRYWKSVRLAYGNCFCTWFARRIHVRLEMLARNRASFIFLLILSTAPALLVTLSPAQEQNGWWHFDRSEYLHNPWATSQLVSIMVLSVVWPSGFFPRCFSAQLPRGAKASPVRLSTCGRGRGGGLL